MKWINCPACGGRGYETGYIDNRTMEFVVCKGGVRRNCPKCTDSHGPTGRVCVMSDGELEILEDRFSWLASAFGEPTESSPLRVTFREKNILHEFRAELSHRKG